MKATLPKAAPEWHLVYVAVCCKTGFWRLLQAGETHYANFKKVNDVSWRCHVGAWFASGEGVRVVAALMITLGGEKELVNLGIQKSGIVLTTAAVAR